MNSTTPDLSANVPYPRPAYAWYVVVVLLFAYILAFVDREVIALLVPDIKHSLQISDTQMSLLLGGAFAIFYTFFGVMIAWFADRGNRRWLIFAGVSVWSVMTMFCGLATTYPLLFLARVGVGAGEAALNPPALSLLKDYFPPDRIGRAIGLYTAGVSSGSGLAFVIGGTVYPKIQATGPQHWPIVGLVEPWQQMFIWVGLPGLLIALLILTIREPVRREFLRTGKLPEAAPVWQTLKFIIQRWKAFIVLFLALASLAIMAYGIGFWIPEFLRRTYHLSPEELGSYIRWRGVVAIVFGLIGVMVGGWLCDVFQRKYADGYVRVCLLAFVLMTIGYSSFALMPTPTLAILMLIPATLGAAAPTAAGAAAVVAIAPPTMRAQIIAFYYFTLNLVGFFIGPTSVALVTDFYFHDESQLRYSLATVATVVAIAGTALLAYNLPHFRRASAEAKAWSA
ncbi:MAG: MFS transporter [Steroidobacteraceae bacterium]|nr:MFS transporter [Nevskiaceae bacterium]MCP5339200.1 MFS transporter [Nevskiaceae bacterium]MCP5359459.1 MFS transporter [Nevskiaceae bacterium]MCP5466801.1 MFS transporter [Nevskiaceae bacterium]MCP5470890.1 MFS transporter [Nevskiaceae bacterium]